MRVHNDVTPVENSVCSSKIKIALMCDSAMPLHGMNPKELKIHQMFSAAGKT
jgi:hypothetical protein